MERIRFFNQRLRNLLPGQSGSVGPVAAIGLVALLGLGALVLDLGRLVSVKGELQKAADAAALAGARALNVDMSVPSITWTPHWSNGQTKATQTAAENQVDRNQVSDSQVQVGYWDLSWSWNSAPADLKSQGISPGATDVPAVKVTISKATGQNSGPVSFLLAPILGKSSSEISASSVAVLISQLPVSSIPAGDAFPMATPKHWVDTLWNPNADSASFRIGSSFHSPDGGQWTSFLIDANNVPTIRSLIDNGNPGPLHVGDLIYIEPGTKDSLYSYAQERIGYTVLLPVVGDDFETHTHTPLLAFVPFYIEAAEGGSEKYIQGHFVPKWTDPGSGGSKDVPNYGAYAYSVKLVR
jgi:Flp pilus assembly protein TadG